MFKGLLLSISVFALGAVGFFVDAHAQSAGAVGPTSLGPLFDEDQVVLSDAARDKLLAAARAAEPAPGQCPALIMVSVQEGDEYFQQALADTRVEIITDVLRQAGIRPGAFDVFGATGTMDDVTIASPTDTSDPALEVAWDPPDGSYRAGGDVNAIVTARDPQTGIGSIQVVLESAAGQPGPLVGGDLFLPPADCRPPEPKTLRVAYTVSHGLEPPPRSLIFVFHTWDFALNQTTVREEVFLADLTGRWLDQETGLEVDIVQTGNSVVAKFVTPLSCSHRNGTGTVTTTTANFNGQIGPPGNRITGSMSVCHYGDANAGLHQAVLDLNIDRDWQSMYGDWKFGPNDIGTANFSRVR